MEDKILIIMTSGPDTPHRCATPFFFATLAMAMDYDVTMFFTRPVSTILCLLTLAVWFSPVFMALLERAKRKNGR